jgi:predicted glycoside hydrolase/deacetylase ChbG (UPF0249 family)
LVAELPQKVRLVFHADDFGLNPTVSDGILNSFSHGLLTSTSILANAPDFGRALDRWGELLFAQRSRDLPSQKARVLLDDPSLPFDFGVHLNLSQGRPLTGRCYPRQLLDGGGRFFRIGRTFAALLRGRNPYRRAIRDELAAQIQRARSAGADVTHLNGHQYVELIPLVGELIFELANEFEIRLIRLAREPGLWRSLRASGSGPMAHLLGAVKRGLSRRLENRLSTAGLVAPRAFFGTMHAGRINLAVCHEFLRTIMETQYQAPALELQKPLVEIAFHPALRSQNGTLRANADGWVDPLAKTRPQECDLLASDSLIALLQRFPVRLGRLSELLTSGRPRTSQNRAYQ